MRAGIGERGVFGGPAALHGGVPGAAAAEVSGGSLRGSPAVIDANSEGRGPAGGTSALAAVTEAALRPDGVPGPSLGGGVMIYRVKQGDTLSGIAADFGLSVQTVIAANPDLRSRSLQIGQELNILPTSGVLYRVRDGETPESVASAFSMTVVQLREFNRTVDFSSFGPRTVLVIPGASPLSASSGYGGRSAELRDLKDYFVRPTEGFNWGTLHRWNAVDIAGNCGTPVIAAAEGLVVDASEDDWSFGYGHYVFIEHPNGTKTRYAHLGKVAASVGDYVKQGARIGAMGATGEATGCHLHFEVYDAKNPFGR